MGQLTMPPQQIMMDNNNAIKLVRECETLVGSDCSEVPPQRCKCVLLGDGAVGKTSLTVSYTTNGYPTEYIPTAFDNYSVEVRVDNKPVQVQLCDTAGQDDFDTLRPFCYPDTDVFLLCFSVVSPTSFHNINEKWIPEIRRTSPKVPIILIGTQSDLRNDMKILIDLAAHKERPVSESAANHTAGQIGAVRYIECSALTQHNLKEVFDTAIYAALRHADERQGGEGKQRKLSKRGDTKVCDTGTKNESLKHSKPGWKKLCCFVT